MTAGDQGIQLEVVLPPEAPLIDLVDEWGDQSFPASDPPSNW